MRGEYFTYFGVSEKCVANQNNSMTLNKLIYEEFRCGHKSAYKTTISTTRVCLLILQFIIELNIYLQHDYVLKHFKTIIYLMKIESENFTKILHHPLGNL